MYLNQFKKIIIIIVILGTLLLVLYSHFYNTLEVDIININKQELDLTDKVISVYGSIRDTSFKNNIIFFKICKGSKCLDSVLFNPTKSQREILLKLENSKDKIKVVGKYTKYKERFELVVYSLRS